MLKPLRYLLSLAAVAAAALSVASTASAKTPAVIVTDAGTDIDDSWAIALALRSPELDLKLVLTDAGDTVYRAKVVARLLEAAGRGDVAIGVGEDVASKGETLETLTPWVAGYDLAKYPGKVRRDGIAALAELVAASDGPVTVIAIGPVPSLALAVKRFPALAPKCRFVGMYGSFDVGYGGGAPSPETNVRVDPAGFRTVLGAGWRDILLTPLDTCGSVGLAGERYHAIWSATGNPLLRELVQSYCIFAPRQTWMTCDYFATRSTTLFDCVAVYLAYSEDLVEVETLTFDVDDAGFTRKSPHGAFKARVAMRWRNRDGFEAELAGRLLAP